MRVTLEEYTERLKQVAELERLLRAERIKYESADRERFVYRATLEQLIQDINQNLGTHDHTDWELAKMVERAESVIADL